MTAPVVWAAIPKGGLDHNDWQASRGQWRALLIQAGPGQDSHMWKIYRVDAQGLPQDEISSEDWCPKLDAMARAQAQLMTVARPGRQPVGGRAMTGAERQAARMQRLRQIEAAAREAKELLRDARDDVIAGGEDRLGPAQMLELQKRAYKAWVALETALRDGRQEREEQSNDSPVG